VRGAVREVLAVDRVRRGIMVAFMLMLLIDLRFAPITAGQAITGAYFMSYRGALASIFAIGAGKGISPGPIRFLLCGMRAFPAHTPQFCP